MFAQPLAVALAFLDGNSIISLGHVPPDSGCVARQKGGAIGILFSFHHIIWWQFLCLLQVGSSVLIDACTGSVDMGDPQDSSV